MRLLAGQLLVPVLAALLVLTTPLGTGQGVHENDLLHPVWPHAHLVNGRIVFDEQLLATRAAAPPDGMTSQPTGRPALGAGNGADAPGIGLAVGPTLPAGEASVAAAAQGRLRLPEVTLPTEFRDQPLDPPPDSFA
jgi:hypothetical protein